MTTTKMTANRTLRATADRIFAVLADPIRHRDIEGSGNVLDPVDPTPLSRAGQQFRMNMFLDVGPTGGAYRMDNTVSVFEPPTAIAWRPALAEADKNPSFPASDMTGWEWRYDLAPAEGATDVTLTYDWSNVPTPYPDGFTFPPFPAEVLDQSLANLARMVERG